MTCWLDFFQPWPVKIDISAVFLYHQLERNMKPWTYVSMKREIHLMRTLSSVSIHFPSANMDAQECLSQQGALKLVLVVHRHLHSVVLTWQISRVTSSLDVRAGSRGVAADGTFRRDALRTPEGLSRLWLMSHLWICSDTKRLAHYTHVSPLFSRHIFLLQSNWLLRNEA